MELDAGQRRSLTDALLLATGGRLDGGRKNIIVSVCPMCGHGGGKFGVYVGGLPNKPFGMSHCFHCGGGRLTLEGTLSLLGLDELMPRETTSLTEKMEVLTGPLDIDETPDILDISMPEGWKRTYKNRYLKSRGFLPDDYEYFPVGTTRGMNRRLDDYVVFPVIMDGSTVGYVSRHTWPKDDIDDWNDRHTGKILRYRNSTDNPFSSLLYNIDAVREGETDTVVLCEGIFDVIGLTRGLELYDNRRLQAVSTFGKKISREQMFLLQRRGVRTVVIGYDNDEAASGSIGHVAADLEPWFDVFCLDYPKGCAKDFGDMPAADMYSLFSRRIVTPRELFLS